MKNRIEIFKPGQHTAMNGEKLNFSDADLSHVATSYAPTLHEAPIVVGHPKAPDPAFGWVQGVEFSDGSLFVDLHQVNPEFAELVDAGAYKKVSASFYVPGATNNPTPDGYYLRHVGFLGAQPPALKGLKSVQFGEDEDGVVTLEFGESDGTVAWALRNLGALMRGFREFLIEDKGLETADKVMPDWEVNEITQSAATLVANQNNEATSPAFAEDETKPQEKEETPDMAGKNDAPDDGELKEKEAALTAEKEALEKAKAEFAEAQSRTSAATFIDGQIAAGKFPPAQRDATVDFMSRLNTAETVSFGEGDDNSMSQSAYFKTLIEGLPQIVNFGEVSGEGGASLETDNPEAVAEKAVAYREEMAGKGVVVTTTQAVDHVTKN